MKETRNRKEDAAVHRSRCVVTEVTRELKTLGLHQVVPDKSGRFNTVDLDPAKRRGLLVFLSELEEHVKILNILQSELARDIEETNRSMNAAATYQRAGMALKKHSQQGRH